MLLTRVNGAAAGAAYFIVADKTVLASARKNSFKNSYQGNTDWRAYEVKAL